MKVSLRPGPDPPRLRPRVERPVEALLETAPSVVLGGQRRGVPLAQPIVPSSRTLFGPRGACLASSEGPLILCDTGHHRLLIWNRVPTVEDTPADFVIGQPSFDTEGRNGKGLPGPATLNVPTGVSVEGGILAVADAWNHRVLVWTTFPKASNQPADLVLGQPSFEDVEANRGGSARADTLNWCYGVAVVERRLIVADTGNRRVLVWNRLPEEHGAPADLVLGQHDLESRDENAGTEPGPLGMRWPHAVAVSCGRPMVTDAGNNRVMVWEDWPPTAGVPCDYVLGQADSGSSDHNRAAYWPTPRALNMPYGLTTSEDWVIAADTANSRLVGWRHSQLGPDAPATGLAGQYDFGAKGDNRWALPVRDSLCWPYSVSACGRTVVVADSGNNRVLLWRLER